MTTCEILMRPDNYKSQLTVMGPKECALYLPDPSFPTRDTKSDPCWGWLGLGPRLDNGVLQSPKSTIISANTHPIHVLKPTLVIYTIPQNRTYCHLILVQLPTLHPDRVSATERYLEAKVKLELEALMG